jgi:hypothetical protein
MKPIQYLLIILFIIAALTMSLTGSGNTKHTLIIRSTVTDISFAVLDQSAQIMSRRLEDFNTGKFDISVNPAKMQIKLTFAEEVNFQVIEKLITQNGIIEFWETYDRDGLPGILDGYDRLFSLLTVINEQDGGAKVGCASGEDISSVNDYLRILVTDSTCKFAWSYDREGSLTCLYALKAVGSGGPVIAGSDVTSAVYDNDIIKIRLTESASGKFADATRRNFDRPIAILLDDEVIATPKVRSEIPAGELEISGRFTKSEAGYLAAMLNNGVLPSGFYVEK